MSDSTTMQRSKHMYEKIKSHWRTIIPVEPSDEQWRMARDAIRILLSDTYNLANRKETQR